LGKWSNNEFSEELLSLDPKEAIGKTIICEDGIPRRVVEITGSMKYPWKFVINEQDPDSSAGHFVSNLSLSAQILGKPMPTKAQEDAFTRAVRVRFGIQEDGSFDKPPRLITKRFAGSKNWN
jgi:hypothetical protein